MKIFWLRPSHTCGRKILSGNSLKIAPEEFTIIPCSTLRMCEQYNSNQILMNSLKVIQIFNLYLTERIPKLYFIFICTDNFFLQ